MNSKHSQKLRNIAVDVLSRCAAVIPAEGLVQRSYRVHIPSGDNKYSSFWIRDAAMMAESGLISITELEDWIELICLFGQNGSSTRQLENQLQVPAWCIADHVNFDGGAVFFPGTYASGNNQGTGSYGYLPPHDNNYYFIAILYQFYNQATASARAILWQPIGGMAPIERAKHAFEAHQIDKASGLCISDPQAYAVDWGFCDTIRKTGLLLFPSLLRMRAANQLSALLDDKGDPTAALYRQQAQRVRDAIQRTFVTEEGWLLSATGRCRQPDVWGSALAVVLGALDDPGRRQTVRCLAQAYRMGTVSVDGYIRHVPLNRDAFANSAWEGGTGLNTYQNGGYWATPTGWYAAALATEEPQLADRLLTEFETHTVRQAAIGAPFEWKNLNDTTYSGCYYGTSGTMPYTYAGLET